LGERGSPDLAPPLDRHDGSAPRSASAAANPRLQVEHLGLSANPEPQQKFRRQQRNVMASSAIDLDEIAAPEILGRTAS
jgi:hypothetical protein